MLTALLVRPILLLLYLLRFANRVPLEAMDDRSPPRPTLFLRLMIQIHPSRFGHLLSNLWITYPHSTTS
jgi:hypothetical protein